MKLLLVDLDDTLIDTSSFKKDFFQKIADQFGVSASEIDQIYEIQKKGHIEGWVKEFEKLLSQKYNKPVGFLDPIVRSSLQHLLLKKDVFEYVKKFEGYKVLLTYGDTELQKEKIKILGLEKHLDDIIITSEKKINYLSAIISETHVTLNNRDFSDVVALEDKESIIADIRAKYPWIRTIHPDNLV